MEKSLKSVTIFLLVAGIVTGGLLAFTDADFVNIETWFGSFSAGESPDDSDRTVNINTGNDSNVFVNEGDVNFYENEKEGPELKIQMFGTVDGIATVRVTNHGGGIADIKDIKMIVENVSNIDECKKYHILDELSAFYSLGFVKLVPYKKTYSLLGDSDSPYFNGYGKELLFTYPENESDIFTVEYLLDESEFRIEPSYSYDISFVVEWYDIDNPDEIKKSHTDSKTIKELILCQD